MADLVEVSTSIVRPENINLSDRVKIHLTPWDLFFLRAEYAVRGLLFPKPDPETDIISQLKASLSVALEIFYPLAGRLVMVENDDETASFFIDCDGSGVKFVHAAAKTVSVSDVLEPAGFVPDFIKCFFPMKGVKNYEGVSQPLLAVQVTEIKDGVFVCYAYHHMVADGTSFWKFFNTWSEICSESSDPNLRKNFPPLVLRDWFLDGIDYPIHIPFSQIKAPRRDCSPLPDLQERVFHFTRKNISELKAKANAEVGFDDRKISSLQAIVGYIWRLITQHRGLDREEETHCKFMVNLRNRLNPPLEKECFGNLVQLGVATTTVGELLDHGLGWAALQLNKMVGSHTNENIRSFAENWVKNIDAPEVGVGSVMTNNSVAVASSPWFNVYGNDFGWGKPIAVRAGPGNTINGKLVIFPGIEEGSIDIQVCLSSDAMKSLLTDTEFLANIVIACFAG